MITDILLFILIIALVTVLMIRWDKRIVFWLEMHRAKFVLKKVSGLYSYPIIISMGLNKKLWWDNFKDGITINTQVTNMASSLAKKLENSLKRGQHKTERRIKMSEAQYNKLLNRYTKFVDFWETENAYRETLKANGEDIPFLKIYDNDN